MSVTGTGTAVEEAVRLRAVPSNVLWGELPTPETAPVAVVADGTRLVLDTVSQEGLMPDQGRDPVAYFGEFGVDADAVLPEAREIAASSLAPVHGPHVVLGPVHVEGALPGDWLRVDMLSLRPRVPYGVISTRHARGCLPDDYPRTEDGEPLAVFSRFCELTGDRAHAEFRHAGGSATIPVAPFLGLCGVTADSAGPLGSIRPGPFGGNIDIRAAVAGTSLYLPVQVPGAGFYVGDPHFAQGDGEIALTALEGSLRAEVRVSVVKGRLSPECAGQRWPFLETDDAWILLGLHEDLDEAMRRCASVAVRFLADRTGMGEQEGYLYLSAAGNFSVTQVVDGVKGVHCVIDKRHASAGPARGGWA